MLLILAVLGSAAIARANEVVAIAADPPRLVLDGPASRWTLLISGQTASGKTIDLTAKAVVTAADSKIVQLRPHGVVRGVRDGETTLRVEASGRTITVPVTVSNSTKPRTFDFEMDIEPMFGRFGCNSAGCHGKAEGQNGFKLSVFGYDPQADLDALVKEGRGRRLFPSAPESSLLLAKATGRVPHGGGSKISRNSEAYETLLAWVTSASSPKNEDVPKPTSLRVEPAERVFDFGSEQQLRVIVRYSDGRDVDVTHLARYQSNRDAVAIVSEDGTVTAKDIPGEAAVMAAYLNEVAVFRVLVPRPGEPVKFERPANNFIDPLVDAKLRKLNIAPSELAEDAEFLRRVSLDIIGTLPTSVEARRFLADTGKDKRAKLVESLLARPEYADLWALKWADLLRVDRAALGPKRAYNYYRWIRQSVAANDSFDKLARGIVTAEGPLDEVGPANFYQVVKKPGERANAISQVFLGVRVACAECHHHPFDRWGQEDYAGLSAFFSGISVNKMAGTEAVASAGKATAKHPRTGAVIPATPLGAPAVEAEDARHALADWMAAPENPYFARNLANRMWAHLFGPGLVDPVDDVRATNPPSNPQLLDALAKHVVDSKFDVKQLIRTITASRAYQTACKPTDSNAKDDRNASRSLFRPVPAEVLADMLSQVTGVTDTYFGAPHGTRAIQLWDSESATYLLKTFGRPFRLTVCECERVTEPTLAGVLHTLNSDEIVDKLRHEGGAIARLVRSTPDDDKLGEELSLAFLSRFPTKAERATMTTHLKSSTAGRRAAAEDLAWALLNTREFQQNH